MTKSVNQNRTISKFSCNRGSSEKNQGQGQDWQQEREAWVYVKLKRRGDSRKRGAGKQGGNEPFSLWNW